MKLLYPLIILFAFSFAEDEYPYFSDAKKQLEFEKLRLYIERVDIKSDIVPIGTFSDYENQYNYDVKIIENNVLLTEYQFLNLISLSEEAEERINLQFADYFNSVLDMNLRYNSTLLENSIDLEIIEKKGDLSITTSVIFFSLATVNSYLYFLDDDDTDAMLLMLMIPLNAACYYLGIDNYRNRGYDIKFKPLSKMFFTYNQSLKYEQINSLADSYNRKIYNNIQSKP